MTAPRYIQHDGQWYVLKSHMAEQMQRIREQVAREEYARCRAAVDRRESDGRGGHRNRISKRQRDEILSTFSEKGQAAAQEIASNLGLHAKYAVRLAWARGLA